MTQSDKEHALNCVGKDKRRMGSHGEPNITTVQRDRRHMSSQGRIPKSNVNTTRHNTLITPISKSTPHLQLPLLYLLAMPMTHHLEMHMMFVYYLEMSAISVLGGGMTLQHR